MPAPPHAREAERLAALQELQLLDTLPEQVFDDVVAVASELCGTPVGLFTLLDETRQWVKAGVGTDLREAPRGDTFCAHTILGDDLLVIPDVTADPRFVTNPFVVAAPHVRFYAGAPIRSPSGFPVGSLCVIDVKPRELTTGQRKALAALARQLEYVLYSRSQMLEAQSRERKVQALEVMLRQTNEDAMREATLLSGLMEQMPEPVIVFAPGGEILRFNKAAEESYGYSAAEAIGNNAKILQPAAGCESQMEQVWGSLAATGEFRGEVTAATKAGFPFPVETAVRLLQVDGKSLCLTINRDLREQRRNAEALFASNELFRHVFDHAAVGMALVGIDGYIDRVNDALAKLLGLPVGDIVGRSVSDFVDESALDRVRAEVFPVVADVIPSLNVESRVKTASGERAVAASLSMVKNSDGQGRFFAVQLVDIHERLVAEAKLRESESSFRLVAENASDIIARYTPDGRYLYVTPSMTRLMGYSRHELIGRSGFELVHEEELELHQAALAHLDGESRAAHVYQHRLRRKNGSYGWMETSVTSVRDATGTVQEIHAVTRDISDRKADEMKLITAMETAENANRAKSVFLGNMSHELRTPLNAILGFAKVLEKGRHGTLNDDQTHYVRDIIESGTHMLMLVEELLELRALEDGLTRFVIEPIDLATAFGDALRMTRELVVERRHQLLTPAFPPCLVVADHRAVVQVLVNLLTNAIKYTPRGGHILLRCDVDIDVVVVSVEDDGVGISPAEQALLFREFERLGQRGQRDTPGTGLGLALTRRLVSALGGEITVQSAKGEGTRFSFTLRRAATSVPSRAFSPPSQTAGHGD